MVKAFVGLGSNQGDGRRNLLTAWEMLGRVSGIVCRRISNPYLTEPVGLETAQWFTNAVGELDTTLQPADILRELLRIEAVLGRDRSQGLDRVIDLDLLYYGEVILNESELIVPHPEIQNRLFVLLPLKELALDFPHPVFRKTTGQMLDELAAKHDARRQSWQEDKEGI